jgi:ribosomal protein S18 acetylase RimI-like enzyme
MKIRKATKKDLDGIVELSHQLYTQQINVCQADINLRKNFKAIQKRAIAKDMKKRKNTCFVAEEGGELVGFISGGIQDDPPVMVERKKGHVWAFYVKEEFRGQGLGKKLFAELKGWFRKKKMKTLRIYVARCNVGAKRLYESIGFKPADFEQLILRM